MPENLRTWGRRTVKAFGIGSRFVHLEFFRLDRRREGLGEAGDVMCVGQGAWEDELLESTRQMDALLSERKVPAWIDYWGHDVAHDWAWWRKQIVYFMSHLLTEETVEYVI